MLPLPLQVTIAMVAYAINKQMARRIEYLLRRYSGACWLLTSMRRYLVGEWALAEPGLNAWDVLSPSAAGEVTVERRRAIVCSPRLAAELGRYCLEDYPVRDVFLR